MYGTKGDTGLAALTSSRNDFERNKLDTFFISGPDVGAITDCRVGVPAWACSLKCTKLHHSLSDNTLQGLGRRALACSLQHTYTPSHSHTRRVAGAATSGAGQQQGGRTTRARD